MERDRRGWRRVRAAAGGVLTDLLSWEWIFFVNVPIGIATALLPIRYVPESRAVGRKGGVDSAARRR